jgi:hypothetical protein
MLKLTSIFLSLGLLFLSGTQPPSDLLLGSWAGQGQETFSIGKTNQGIDILVTRYGSGSKALVLAHGIHGAFETNTIELGDFFRLYFRLHHPPQGISLYIIHNLNPDSFNLPKDYWQGERILSRFNARGVDLNRNWGSSTWKADVAFQDANYNGIGGTAPFSEPETREFRDLLLRLQVEHSELLVVNYHSYRYLEDKVGIIQPAYSANKQPLDRALHAAQTYQRLTDLQVITQWNEYEVPGEFLSWAGEAGIHAMDVELDSITPPWQDHLPEHLSGVINLIIEMLNSPE